MAVEHELELVTRESVQQDLAQAVRDAKDSYDENKADKLESLLCNMEQDSRVANSDIVSTGYNPHPLQKKVHEAMMDYRFTVLICHRRFGKTVLAVNALGDSALRCTKPNGRYVYLAPQLKQAKQIAWMYLKAFAANVEGARKHEGELYIEFPNGSRITLYGGDNSESMRGLYIDGIVIDEPADIKGHVWGEIIRPALADRKGWAIWIGTPKGLNQFHERYVKAQKNDKWQTFLFRVDETNLPWLPEKELALLREELSESQYRQEMLCDFSASVHNVIIPLDLVSDSMARVVQHEGFLHGMSKVIGVDVARFGDDKSCIVKRWGHYMYPPLVFDQRDNMEIVGHLAHITDEFEPDAIFVDGGRGEGVIDRMRNLGKWVFEVQFGSKAIDKRYKDRRTEMYFKMLQWLEEGGVLPDDHELKAELSAPTFKFNATSQKIMEEKDDTKKTLGRSPDIADAAALTFAAPVTPAAQQKVSQAVKVNSGGYHPHKKMKQGR